MCVVLLTTHINQKLYENGDVKECGTHDTKIRQWLWFMCKCSAMMTFIPIERCSVKAIPNKTTENKNVRYTR